MNYPAAELQCIPPAKTKAHECLFQPRSVFESIWNNNRTLQNQMLSIRSSKAPCEIPGGRMKTKSWRFAPLNCFFTNGWQEMRCSFACLVWPIASVLNSAICPLPPVACIFRRVASRAGWMQKNSEIFGNSEIRSQILTTFVPKIVPKFAISFFLLRS